MDDTARGSGPLHRVAGALRPRLSTRRLVKWGIVAVVLIVGAVFAIRYWIHAQNYTSTDDAYVNADRTQIAAQIAGQVLHVFVRDQQHVNAGDPLFEIDPEPFQLAIAAAEAQLRLARQTVSEQEAAVTAANAQLAQRRAESQNAQSNLRRVRNLIAQHYTSAQSVEDAQTQVATAAAAVNAAQANLEQARRALGEPGENNPSVQAAVARLNQARLDLSRTHVNAPTSGTIANLTLRPGSPVQPLVPVFALVSDRNFWVDANFKETQLNRVQPGQQATIQVDMYPNHTVRGEVQSLSGGAGSAFSLLPPENATGNWVKVTQRVPVRVRVVDPDPKHPLRVGTTATVQVAVR
jgi:membrane fusion protein (multidrug efflux system)